MKTQCAPVVKENNGDKYIAFWNMPVLQPMRLQRELQRKATPLNATEQAIFDASEPEIWNGGSVWKKASAVDMVDIMYQGTKIQGVWDKVPSKLRGVFWMRDNGAPEELVVLQYGRYFEESNQYIMPLAPFMWGWPISEPPQAPHGGVLYKLGLNATVQAAYGLTGNQLTLSYKFGPCPSGAKYCSPDHPGDDTAYATMQSHNQGNLLTVVNMGNLIDAILLFLGIKIPSDKLTGAFTLQEMDGVKPGSLYKRTCHWGLGRCDCIEMGSYDLTKIVDGDGNHIEPYYSDFIKYMGDHELFAWMGFKSQKDMNEVIDAYKKQAADDFTEL